MQHLIVGTAGHIDHGKSALVLALTGTDPDRLKEEKDRGITIELGFAHWSSPDATFSFVDVPGHERFVKNMLAGVGGIDAVLMVVAADESVMPQTREHFDICRLLRVPHGILAITKADLVDADTLELVRLETRELVAGSFLADAPIVSVSARTGEGLEELCRELTVLARRVAPRTATGAIRLPVDRVFTVRGFGTVATGTLISGRVQPGAELMVLPAGRAVKVRGVQVHGADQEAAEAGQRVAMNLGGVELGDVHRGDTLASPDSIAATRVLDARVELLPAAKPLKHGTRVRFHQGTSEVLGRVALAAVLVRRDVGGEAPVASSPELAPGGEAYVRIRLESAAVLGRGDRFILRAYSPPITIGGGEVLDPCPDRGPVRNEAATARLAALDPALVPAGSEPAATDRAIAALVSARGAAGLPVASLVIRLGIPPDDVPATVTRHQAARTAQRAGDTLISADVAEELAGRLTTLLADHHRLNPLLEGMPREEARERLFARAGEGVFEHVVTLLERRGRIAGRDRLALASHSVSLSAEEDAARGVVESAYLAAGLKPPELEQIAATSGLGVNTLERVMKLLLRQRVLVRVDTLVFHDEALRRLREDMIRLKASSSSGGARIDVAAFKERYGVTRKYAIPLLEYLDRERITRRVGEGRVLI